MIWLPIFTKKLSGKLYKSEKLRICQIVGLTNKINRAKQVLYEFKVDFKEFMSRRRSIFQKYRKFQ